MDAAVLFWFVWVLVVGGSVLWVATGIERARVRREHERIEAELARAVPAMTEFAERVAAIGEAAIESWDGGKATP